MPFFRNFIIMFSEFIWSFFELFSSPFFIVTLFILEFVMSFTAFWFRVVLFSFRTAFITCSTFTSFFVYKLFYRL